MHANHPSVQNPSTVAGVEGWCVGTGKLGELLHWNVLKDRAAHVFAGFIAGSSPYSSHGQIDDEVEGLVKGCVVIVASPDRPPDVLAHAVELLPCTRGTPNHGRVAIAAAW